MRKIVFRNIILLLMLIFPVSVSALSGTISLSCTSGEFKPGDEVTCTVTGTSSPTGVTQFEFNLSAGDGLTFKDLRNPGDDKAQYFSFKNSWQGEVEDMTSGLVAGYRSDPTSSNFNIGEFVVIVGEGTSGRNISVTISSAKYHYDEEASSDVEGTSASIKVADASTPDPEPDNPEPEITPELKNISVVSGGVLSPAFSKNTDNYAIRLDSSDTTEFKVSAEPADGKFSVSAKNTDTGESINLSNNITFKANDDKYMSITITVSVDDKTKDYVLLIDRPIPNEVGEPILNTLIVGGVTVNLIHGQYEYTVSLSSDVITSGYVVVAKLADPDNFKFSDYSKGLIDKDLYGDNPLEITVEPKVAGSGYGSNTYVVNITKSGGTPSSSSQSSSSSTRDIIVNPGTGTTSGIIMGIIIVVSFFVSIYYYKKNMSDYN